MLQQSSDQGAGFDVSNTSRFRGRSCGLALRFATIGVNQFGGGSSRKADVRPPFCRVTGFQWWANHSGRYELVEAARCALCLCARRDKLRDDATMSRDRNTLAGLNPPDVPTQIVLQFADACGGHQ
jgi:hypothetical protein